jgi:hypothetical protein
MPPKKKKAKKDDVDPKILRKIKEPKMDLADFEDDEEGDDDNIVIDDEKTPEPDEENF